MQWLVLSEFEEFCCIWVPSKFHVRLIGSSKIVNEIEIVKKNVNGCLKMSAL